MARGVSARSRSAERPPRQIFPIAVKYGAVSGIILLTFVLWVGNTSTQLALQATADQVNSTGSEQVQLVSSLVTPFWADSTIPDTDQQKAQTQLAEQLNTFIEKPGPHTILDVLVLDDSGRTLIASARGGDRLKIALGDEIAPPMLADTGVRVHKGSLANGNSIAPVRSFQLDLADDSDQVIG